MPRKSTKKRGKSAEQNAFEFTGEEAVQADKEARARPTFKRQKISILSTLPDATQRLAALAKKPFFCTRTDEQDDGQKTTLESKRESKPRLGRRSVSYHGPKIQKNYASLDTQKFMNRKTRQSVNRRASTESVVTPPIKREVTPDPPTMPGGTQESSEASSAPRRSGRKRFRTTKAYLAYEDARRHIGGKKRVRTTEQEGVRNNRTLSKRENTPKSAGVERVSKGKEALASQSSKMIEPMPMEPVNDKPKTGGGGEDGDIEIPRTKPSEHTAGTNSEESGKGTRVQTQNNFASVARKRDGRETSAAVKTEHSANVFTDAHQRPSSVHGTAQDPEHVGHKKSNMALKKAIGTDKDQQQGSTTRGVEVHGTAVIKQVSPTCLGPGSDLPLSGACTDNQEQIQRSQAFVDIEDQESEPGKHAKSNSGGDSEADTKLDQLRGKSDPHAEHQNISDDSLIESPVTPVNSRKDPAEVAKAHVQTLNIHAENSGTKDEKSVSAVALVNRRLSLDAGEMESQDRKAENREGETSQSRKENAQRPGSECMSSPKMVKRDRETRLSTSEICKLSSTKDGEVRHNSPCEEKIGGFDPDVSVSVDEPQDSKGMEPDTLGSDLSENKGYPSLKMMNSKTATRSKGPGEKSKSTLSLSRQLGTDKSISESDRRRTQVNTVVPEIVTEVLNNCTSAAKKDATSKNTEILARGQEKDSPLCSVWDSYVLADPSVNALQQNTERQDPSQETVNPTTREETCIEPTGPSSLNSGGKQQITERANVPFKTVPDETMKASQKPQAAVQHVEKTKQTFSKRVRFLEPDASTLSRDSRRDLSGILKMKLRKARRRQVSFIDGPDVSVMTGHATEPNGKEERMLLDELQYLLDGIFKPSGNSGKKSPQLESQLIAKTLVSLISLLKRKPHQKMSKEGGEHESAMIQILLKQPSLFKTIVGKLCSVFGKSRSVDAVLAVVFVLIFRETPKLRLIEAPELDILLNAFFRSSAAALKDDDVGNTSKSQSKEGAAPDVKRRRGRLAKRFEETNTDDSFLSTLNKVVSEASIIEDDFNGFKGETVGAPPPCAFPNFATAPSPRRSRSSFRHVRSIFERPNSVSHPVTPIVSRRTSSPIRPPDTRPDPTKCRPRDRQVVRTLFEELNARVTSSPIKLDSRKDLTVCESDSIHSSQFQTMSNTELLRHYADTVDQTDFRGKIMVEQSETEAASELEPEPEGSYAHYHHGHKPRELRTSNQHQYAHQTEQEPASEEIRRSVLSDSNSFDQVAEELEKELHPFESIDQPKQDAHGAIIHERHQDRIFGESERYSVELPPESTQHHQRAAAQQTNARQEEREEEEITEISDHESSHHDHDHDADDTEAVEFDEPRTYHIGEEQSETHHEEEVLDDEMLDDEVLDEEIHGDQSDTEIRSRTVDDTGQKYRSQHSNTDGVSTIGPPPSLAYKTERLSRNVADAMSNIWERFWKDDVRLIAKIIHNRVSQLAPYLRRFIAHVVAFWGNVTYIRRALAAFIRILNRDERVRELMQRIGWASATTVKVFLSICGMLLSATLQIYHLMRDKVIPDLRRVVPIVYYKFVMGLTTVSQHSPWSILFGPFSFEFAIDSKKLPEVYFLHDKLGVDRDDVTFATVNDLADSIRHTVANTVEMYRTRRGVQPSSMEYEADHEQGSESEVESEEYIASESTPVHTQSTEEDPFPAPTMYSGPQYHAVSKQSKRQSHRRSFGPLAEKTNQDDREWHQPNAHRHMHRH